MPNLFKGNVSRDFTGQKVLEQYARDLLMQSQSHYGDRKRYQEIMYALADLYCQGYELPWEELFGARKPQLMSLPTYPFAREQYWVPEIDPSRW